MTFIVKIFAVVKFDILKTIRTTMKKNIWKYIYEYSLVIFGSMVAAFAIEEFLVPNTILDGGVVGVSIMINALSGFTLGLLTLIINIPFLLIGLKKLGKEFIIKSAVAMAFFSIFLEQFESWGNATEETLLAVVFGGTVLGIGVGIVIKFGGCLDGTETVAIMLNKKFRWPVGQTVLIFNIVIYSIAAILFGRDRAMFSLLTYFIASKVIDIVEEGFNKAKAAMIITNECEEIASAIYHKLGRTVTILEGEGLISGKKVVLYCVLNKFEVKELRNIIDSVDSSAFIAISDVEEIIGKHIKKSDGNTALGVNNEQQIPKN